MRLTKKQNGYTIVETMIVLAVTGSMLATTVLLISGQVARYRFREITYNSQQAIQSAINDVQTGYFDKVDNPLLLSSLSMQCTTGDIAVAGDSNCVYIGKQIDISPNGQLKATPLVLRDNQAPSITNPKLLDEKAVISQLPIGVSYGTTNTTFYVLFTNYPDTTISDFKGGAQSVRLYNSANSLSSVPSGGYKINLKEGARNACMLIGENGNMGVEVEPDVCP